MNSYEIIFPGLSSMTVYGNTLLTTKIGQSFIYSDIICDPIAIVPKEALIIVTKQILE
jgi:hypothetical protein